MLQYASILIDRRKNQNGHVRVYFSFFEEHKQIEMRSCAASFLLFALVPATVNALLTTRAQFGCRLQRRHHRASRRTAVVAGMFDMFKGPTDEEKRAKEAWKVPCVPLHCAVIVLVPCVKTCPAPPRRSQDETMRQQRDVLARRKSSKGSDEYMEQVREREGESTRRSDG